MPELNGVSIADTFAEAFTMVGTRVLITARSFDWAKTAATQITGFATSVIACDCEAGIERSLSPDETPDGRPGVAVLMFGFTARCTVQSCHQSRRTVRPHLRHHRLLQRARCAA